MRTSETHQRARPAAGLAVYEAAIGLFKIGRYPEAIERLVGYLADYRQSGHADDARYWLGEAYYKMGKYEHALTAFQQLLAEYPGSEKREAALLKIGYIRDILDYHTDACRILNKVLAEHTVPLRQDACRRS